jgi:hypothetical protein
MEIADLLKKLETDMELAKEGILKAERYYKTKYDIEDRLKEIAPNLNERAQLKIEKNISMWRSQPRSGVFMPPGKAEMDSLQLWTLLQELQATTEEFVESSIKTQNVILGGQPHEGRKYFRSILESADSDLILIDSYFKPVVLDILTEYLIDKPNLKVRIMAGQNERLPAFRASYNALIAQYPSRIEARIVSDHPRYIVVDDVNLFNPDHSFDQWGSKTVDVHQVSDPEIIQKIKEKIERDWAGGSQI